MRITKLNKYYYLWNDEKTVRRYRNSTFVDSTSITDLIKTVKDPLLHYTTDTGLMENEQIIISFPSIEDFYRLPQTHPELFI